MSVFSELMYILTIPVTQRMCTDIIAFPFSSLYLSLPYLIYPIYRSTMRMDGRALAIWDALFPQIPTIIHLAGIRRHQSYLSLSRYTPIDSLNANKLGSIGTLMKFKGERYVCVCFSSKMKCIRSETLISFPSSSMESGLLSNLASLTTSLDMVGASHGDHPSSAEQLSSSLLETFAETQLVGVW